MWMCCTGGGLAERSRALKNSSWKTRPDGAPGFLVVNASRYSTLTVGSAAAPWHAISAAAATAVVADFLMGPPVPRVILHYHSINYPAATTITLLVKWISPWSE